MKIILALVVMLPMIMVSVHRPTPKPEAAYDGYMPKYAIEIMPDGTQRVIRHAAGEWDHIYAQTRH